MSHPVDIKQVPWRVKDALALYVLAWILVPLLIVLGLSQFAGNLPIVQGFINGLSEGDITANFAFAVINAIASLMLIGFYLKRYGVGWKFVGLRRFSLGRAILIIVGIFLVFTMLVGLAYEVVSFFYPGFNPNEVQSNEFTSPTTTDATRLSFIALVVVPPIVEELVFRGFLFPAFSRRFGYIFGAIITSLLFGLAHLQLNVGIYTLVLSLLLCWMYVRLGSIIPGIVFHAINNYIAFSTLISQ